MTTYYVSTTGNNGGNGSATSPWRSINYAMQQNLQPGDEVVVRPGTYNESVTINNGGSAAGDVTLRSEVPGAALIRPPSGAWNAIYVWDSYVTVDGFDIGGARGDGIEANDVHHITVSNNVIHGSGESGIQFNWCEFITVDSNVTYNNASSGWFSGISVYQSRNITGDTTTPGYRTVITNNISYGNLTKSGSHTDGNGIIIDDFQSTQTSGYSNYTYPTLVENNLVYDNGGKGIAVHWSDNVTVRNNTAYHNNQDLLNTGTWRGELSNQDSNNTVWVNNIAVADPSVQSNNTAIGFYGGNSNVTWANNLTYNGTPGQSSVNLQGGSNPAPTAANGNLLGVNPGFVAPGSDFNLKSGSAAVDKGTTKYGLASSDLDGGPRAVGTVDIGALEQGSGSGGGGGGGGGNVAPVAVDDSGFSTALGTSITIKAAALLANDSDGNGDPLSITAVSGARNGTVSLATNGDILFKPAAGFTGAAQFDYTVSDGKSGTDTGKVSIDVIDLTDTFTFFNGTGSPAVLTDADRQSVNLGMKFVVEMDGEIDALRYYKSSGNAGPHSAYLWSDTGRLLASVNFTNETSQGWQEAALSQPVQVSANQTYVVSYYAPKGGYSVSSNYFSAPVDVGPMSTLASSGVYAYGSAGKFPTQTYNSSNYWVDVVFDPAGGSGGGGTGGGTAYDPIGEAGVVTFSQGGPSQWQKVTFAQQLDNPSVVMGGLSSNDLDPGTIRVRNVTDYGFEFQLDEWDYLDGSHPSETVRWIAIEQGVHTLSNGQVIQAGSSSVSSTAASVALASTAFGTAPTVLAQVVTNNQANAVTDRVWGVSSTGFTLKLDHEESKAGTPHANETVDWIAVQSGGSANTNFVAGKTANAVTDQAYSVDFAGAFGSSNYAFVADMQTRDGKDPADIRVSGVTASTIGVSLDEEQSQGTETSHTSEVVGYLAADIGLIYTDLALG